MKIEQSIRAMHNTLAECYTPLKDVVSEFLKDTCEVNGWLFSQRLKSDESFALKLITGREVDDFYACTITVPTLKEVADAVNLVQSCFNEIDRRPAKQISSRPTEFHFDSLRLYCVLKPGVEPSSIDGLKFEVQVKTFLEDAWSKATHDFSYKSGEISWSRERLAAQLKAILDNVELSIAEMPALSASQILDKDNINYMRKNKILEYFISDIAKSSNILMPKDMRRLVDVTDDVLKVCKKSLDDLKGWIEAETESGRGKSTTNLSIYSVLIQTIFNQHGTEFVRILANPKLKPKILVPSEITLPPGVDLANLRGTLTTTS